MATRTTDRLRVWDVAKGFHPWSTDSIGRGQSTLRRASVLPTRSLGDAESTGAIRALEDLDDAADVQTFDAAFAEAQAKGTRPIKDFFIEIGL